MAQHRRAVLPFAQGYRHGVIHPGRERDPSINDPCLFGDGGGKVMPDSMEMTIMLKRSIALLRVCCAVFFIAFPTVHLAAAPCWGSDRSPADPTITLNADNEPLRSVFAKISKTTSWKIQAPDKWMNRPITQTLTAVPLAEGMRSILKSAGIENILLLYDDNSRVITVFDTETALRQSTAVPPGQTSVQQPVVLPLHRLLPLLSHLRKPVRSHRLLPPTGSSPGDDPVLKRPTGDSGSGQTPGSRRAKRRNQRDEE